MISYRNFFLTQKCFLVFLKTDHIATEAFFFLAIFTDDEEKLIKAPG